MMEWIQSVFAVLKTIEIRDIIDILAIAFIIFSLFKLVKETRAAQLLKGVVALLIIYLISSLCGLMMLTTLLRTFLRLQLYLLLLFFSLKSENIWNKWVEIILIKSI